MKARTIVQTPENDQEIVQATNHEAMEKEAGDAIRRIVVSAFINMAGMDATVGAQSRQTDVVDPRNSISGTIDWAGSWRGIGTLDCTPAFACDLASLMLATEATTLDQNALDAVAEMTNIIFGGMKRQLEPIFGRMDLSTPTVAFEGTTGGQVEAPRFMVIPVQVGDHSLQLKLFITQVREWVKPAVEEVEPKAIARAA